MVHVYFYTGLVIIWANVMNLFYETRHVCNQMVRSPLPPPHPPKKNNK